MTAQITEKILYEGTELSICTEPLANYFTMANVDPGFRSAMTGLWLVILDTGISPTTDDDPCKDGQPRLLSACAGDA